MLSTGQVSQNAYADVSAGMFRVPLELMARREKACSDFFLPVLDETGVLALKKVVPAGRALPAIVKLARDNGFDEFFCDPKDQEKVLGNLLSEAHNRIKDPATPTVEKAKLISGSATLLIQNATSQERLGKNLEEGLAFSSLVAEQAEADPALAKGMSSLLSTDYDLFTHSVNLCMLSTSFGSYLGLKGADLANLAMGGLYHDIGKGDIPHEVLMKPGKLDYNEWQIMKKHPEYGYKRLVEGYPGLPKEIKLVALQHHEDMDGGGYPNMLPAKNICYPARIMRVLDVYDAITARRVYKPPMSPFEAIKIMQSQMAGKIPTDILRKFIEYFGDLGPDMCAKQASESCAVMQLGKKN